MRITPADIQRKGESEADIITGPAEHLTLSRCPIHVWRIKWNWAISAHNDAGAPRCVEETGKVKN